MTTPAPTLGTLVRTLIDLLDPQVEVAYAAAGLAWRPRFTPVLRALMRSGPASIKALAEAVGVSHSAISQTVSQMSRDGLVELRPGADGRERIAALTPRCEAMIPALQRQWAATNAAAEALDAELSTPLSAVLEEAITALKRKPFGDRIAVAAETLAADNQP